MESQQYIDHYLRRKQQQHVLASSGIGAPHGTAHPAAGGYDAATGAHNAAAAAADRAHRGTADVQLFVNRTDAMHHQLSTFEDKVLNLTKLVKLSQALAEEKETELRRENHDLRARIKKQDHVVARLAGDLQELHARLPGIVAEAVLAATAGIKAEARAAGDAAREASALADRKCAETRSDILEAVLGQADALVASRVAAATDATAARIADAAQRHAAEAQAVERRFEALETTRLEQVRRHADERAVAVAQTAKEQAVAEVKSCLRATADDAQREAAAQREAQARFDARCAALEASLADFVAMYKEHTVVQASRMEETTTDMKQLVALQEQTRTVVGAELERTKEWATRNLHRLKKHIDGVNADAGSLRDAQSALALQLERVRRDASDERAKLGSILEVKTKEANALTELVDREIQGIHSITSHYYQQQRKDGGAADGAGAGVGGLGAAGQRAAGHAALYDDLAFADRRA